MTNIIVVLPKLEEAKESKVSWSAAVSRSRVSVLRVPRRSARRTD